MRIIIARDFLIRGSYIMKKRSDILLSVLCLILAVVLGVATLVKPSAELSERENRVMASFPRLSVRSLTEGEFSRGLGSFFEDQFPFRTLFTRVKAESELLMGRRENNGVIYGKAGYLILEAEYDDLSLFRENLAAIDDFYTEMCNKNIETAVFFAPRGVDVLEKYLPDGYPEEEGENVWNIARETLPYMLESNATIEEALCEDEYVWYKTDHHWTPLGAYEGYKNIVTNFDKTAMDISELEYEYICDEFYGSIDSRSESLSGEYDEIFFLRSEDDDDVMVVNYDTCETQRGVYFKEYLSAKDKYKVFMGGNFGHLGVYSETEADRETLLVIKDSFANCTIPFFTNEYELEIYDLRYFKGKISDEIDKIAPDKILILYGIDTAVTDGSLKLLQR